MFSWRQIVSRWSSSLIINLQITLMHWSWVLDLVLWDHSLDVWSSWSCASINSSSHQLISLPVLGWKQSVKTPTCLFGCPVWTTCSSEEIYQLSLLASKHYILKRMNPTWSYRNLLITQYPKGTPPFLPPHSNTVVNISFLLSDRS